MGQFFHLLIMWSEEEPQVSPLLKHAFSLGRYYPYFSFQVLVPLIKLTPAFSVKYFKVFEHNLKW